MTAAKAKERLREPGIEPGASAWQAEILPLNHSHFRSLKSDKFR